jgi:predicted outer membrane lipoprotein
MSVGVVVVACAFGIAWALYELVVWLPRKRRELEQLSRDAERFEAPE